MSAIDELKSLRSKGYDSGKPEKPGMDSGKPNETPRTIKLTDDEQKIFAQAQPGEDLACEVHGTYETDGKLLIMSVSPMGSGSIGNEENDMAAKVAMKVQPTMQPSPS